MSNLPLISDEILLAKSSKSPVFMAMVVLGANEADAMGWMLLVHLFLLFFCMAAVLWFFLRLRRREKDLPPYMEFLMEKEGPEEKRNQKISRPTAKREEWERDPDWWKSGS